MSEVESIKKSISAGEMTARTVVESSVNSAENLTTRSTRFLKWIAPAR